MAITGDDLTLIDKETGILLAPDTTVIVPEVTGEMAYDILYDEDSAKEYGDTQGLALEDPGADGIPVNTLDEEPRGYLAIDTDNGYTADASNLLLVEYDDELSDQELLDKALVEGTVPVAPIGIREIEGLPFASVVD